MGIVLLTLLILEALVQVECSPGEEEHKLEVKKPQFSHMYYSLDLSVQLTSSIYISDQKRIDCDLYRDITVKPGVIVNEIHDGDNEIWKGKPNRDLMKLIVIQRKENNTYIVITKDRGDRLAETHIIVTKVSLTFSPFKDCDYNLMVYSEDGDVPRSNNLRSERKLSENEDKTGVKQPKGPFQSKEYMSELLPDFVTRPKFREMDEDEKKKNGMK